jgi:hypothetical protein
MFIILKWIGLWAIPNEDRDVSPGIYKSKKEAQEAIDSWDSDYPEESGDYKVFSIMSEDV